jgi:CheY-like chemotaxis protein
VKYSTNFAEFSASVSGRRYGTGNANSKPDCACQLAGCDALHILKGGSKPDMIITDLNVAAMNGIQLIGEACKLAG